MGNKNFNIVICGVGGQGLVTLTKIIADAAMKEGYDVKTSELHGLSQRGGSVQTFIRFGKKTYSPLFSSGRADLIIGLEITEALRNINYANKETTIVANSYLFPYEGGVSKEEIISKLDKSFKGKKHILNASDISKKEFGDEVFNGIYILGYIAYQKMIPLEIKTLFESMAENVPDKYLSSNKKAFELAK